MANHHGWAQALEQRSETATMLSGERGRRYVDRVFGDVHRRTGNHDEDRFPTWLMREYLDQSLRGEVYYWAPDFVQVIADTFERLPETTLTPKLLPAPAGYCYLDGVVPIPPFRDLYDGEVEDDVRAFSWASMVDPKDGTFLGLFVLLYTTPNRSFTHVPFPTTVYFWPTGTTTVQMAEYEGQAREERVKRRLNAVVTAFLFLHQEVMVTASRRPDRATRRRLERANPELGAEVKVVELRVRHYAHEKSTEPQTVEWSCRWLVRGHWRSQFYPSTNTHHPRWIQPYAKGPADKPLKTPATTVFEVVR